MRGPAGRLGRALADPAAAAARTRVRLRQLRLLARNRFSRRPVTGDAPVVVDLTSFGRRIGTVHHTIESIAAGSVRPRRLILWLDDTGAVAAPPVALRRLQRRGLEILVCPDLGPHKKQYPYALLDERPAVPLVTADDDVLYPRSWLAELLAAHREHPGVITGYRAHRVVLCDGAIAPYAQWRPCTSAEPSFTTFCTGVSGVLYPPAALAALRAEGEEFLRAAPRADDVWVHAVAVRHGIRSRQVAPRQAEFTAVPGTQVGTLYRHNVKENGNDVQIAASYGAAALARLQEDDGHGR